MLLSEAVMRAFEVLSAPQKGGPRLRSAIGLSDTIGNQDLLSYSG